MTDLTFNSSASKERFDYLDKKMVHIESITADEIREYAGLLRGFTKLREEEKEKEERQRFIMSQNELKKKIEDRIKKEKSRSIKERLANPNLTPDEQNFLDSLAETKDEIIEDGIPSKYYDVEAKEADFWHSYDSYYIYGGVGCGKTRLAYAIFKAGIEREIEDAKRMFILNIDDKGKRIPLRIRSMVKIYNFPKLLQEIRKSYGNKDNAPGEKDNWWTEKDDDSPEGIANFQGTVIIDDLGVEKNSEWVSATLYTIINGRYENELPTILISNLSLVGLSGKIDDRIVSRISEMCIVKKIEGEDRRLNKHGSSN